jgi:type IV secretory pathway VirB9-like protein
MRIHAAVIALALATLSANVPADASTGVREVSASERSLIPLTTKVRYTTMILLPEGEEILDVVCGDRDFWVISATENIAHVKAAKEGAATNLNLVTASGAVYSFLLKEEKAGTPDLKVYVAGDSTTSTGRRKYYSAADVNALREELTEARTAIAAAQRHADETIAAFKQRYPLSLRFPYDTPKYERPFFVRSIWHDGKFTYIQTNAKELPALYEVKDGDPALVNFQVRGRTYVVPKVLDRAYLSLGKDRFEFRQDR